VGTELHLRRPRRLSVLPGCRQQPSRQHRRGVQFPEHGWHDRRVTINRRIEAGRPKRRVLAPVSCAARRLEQAKRERTWAPAPARAKRISIRTLATAVGLVTLTGASVPQDPGNPAAIIAGCRARCGSARGPAHPIRVGLGQLRLTAVRAETRPRRRVTSPCLDVGAHVIPQL
jgi:hypothetical protein